eukprot:CAMPEP_0170551140 /NCGR_PEP_ID=MMETSP0211-20121228/9164_1 /TAXON_ID=311385 /ORGANISM="Pseudokeronopsis sp., Strain OXSARD2" /LENGTH=36 /DNA_ID= /DNA_START= /DNA_END= /DNA_ORIENTATION=
MKMANDPDDEVNGYDYLKEMVSTMQGSKPSERENRP